MDLYVSLYIKVPGITGLKSMYIQDSHSMRLFLHILMNIVDINHFCFFIFCQSGNSDYLLYDLIQSYVFIIIFWSIW